MTKRLSKEEIEQLYAEYSTPKHVIAHCKAVSYVAVRLAQELNKNGYSLDLSLVEAAGLAHDVARTQDDHGSVAAERLNDMGYAGEADIIKVHMYYSPFNDVDKLNECDMVCLADRLVKEDKYVGLDERIEYILNKAPNDEKIQHRILERKAETEMLLRRIAEVIGQSVDRLFLKDKLDKLLKRVEKPGRYIGGEINSVTKSEKDVKARFAFAFPDLYEIGMSYLGLQILYKTINDRKDFWCERVFAPAADMETLMRSEYVPLFTLESKTPVKDMDFLGFTLQYEMSYTTVLNMIDLAGLHVHAKDRKESDPIIVAGGPCAYNPEPLADFIDVFLIGDGEKALPDFIEKYTECKEKGLSKKDFLKEASNLEGVYVPSLYDVEYNDDGTIKKICKLYEDAPDIVKRAILPEIESINFPDAPIIPMVEAVHDRAVVETFRGCTRGCRFCQAGMIYRPVRERSKNTVLKFAKEQLENTGNDELSLLSLSTSDYSDFEQLSMELIEYCKGENVSLSLPSLRIDRFAFEVLNKIQEYKKSGLTYAPEAGTQRLRDVINKGVTEKDIYNSVEQAIELGWRHIKLYFMIGLPTETYEDLDGIAEIARNIMDINRKLNGPKGGKFNVTVSVSNFVPKADTPFQWESQDTAEEFADKHNYLSEKLRIKGVTFNYHDSNTSRYEAVFARGDRRTGRLLFEAFKQGCKLDGWTEYFKADAWEKAFAESGVNADFYTTRKRDFDEVLPWDIIDCGVSKRFLLNEAKRAYSQVTTKDCRYGCVGCGINQRVKCPMEGFYDK